MSVAKPRKIFVNMPVADLTKSMAFFTGLGFTFNMQFTNDSGACMVVSDDAFVMLLATPFFRGFTDRAICNTATHTETLCALSCESRAEVEEFLAKAMSLGASAAKESQDHGFMVQCSFYDLDGHHWEVFWMDPNYMQPS